MYKSSQKKINEDKSKKSVSIGLNKKLPAKVSSEIGIPQQSKMGMEIKVIKSWIWMKLMRFLVNLCANAVIFIEK